MSVIANNMLAGAAGQGGAAAAAGPIKSLRFNKADSPYLNRTMSGGNRGKATISCWLKKCNVHSVTSEYIYLMGVSSECSVYISSNDKMHFDFYHTDGSTWAVLADSDMLFRDVSAWYHIVLSIDSSAGTSNADRVKLYVNGAQKTFTFATYGTGTITGDIKHLNESGQTFQINSRPSASYYGNFYLANYHYIDGQALAPTDFGETRESDGVWVPKEFTGSYNAAGGTQHWRQATSSDNPSNAVGTVTYRTQRAFTNPQTSALAWDHQNTNVIGLQNITGVTSLRLKINSRGGAKVGVNTGSMNSIGSQGGDYSNNNDSNAAWVTISNPPSTLTSVAVTGGGSGTGNFCTLWAIEVNGTRVVDGPTAGVNGFHLLDFANEATVGHDSSGNENDFTANNLTTTAPTSYSGTSSIAVNNSNTNQSGSLAAVFNGTQVANSSNAYGFTTGAMDFTWTPDSAISYGNKVRVWTGFAGGSVYLNGGSAVSTANNDWTTLVSGSSGTITSIQFTVGSGGGWWAGLEVDDVVLVDGNPADFDVLFDVPTNGTQSDTGAGGEVSGNYAVWNPLGGNTSNYGTFSNGNLDASLPASGKALAQTIFPESGKWYCEIDFVSGGGAGGGLRIGVINENNIAKDLGSTADSWAYLADGRIYHNGSAPSYGVTSAPGDLLMMALDIDAGKLWYGKNGTWMASGDPANGNNPSQTFTAGQKMSFSAQSGSGTVQVITANWGQRAWSYTAPSGFNAVCTTNLPDPTIADGSDYFDVKTWTGNGGTQSISNLEFSPDLVWIKARGHLDPHALFDTVRGVQKRLSSNLTNAEVTSSDGITSFNSDGWTMGANGSNNANNLPYVGWIWDAGSSTVSNTDGSITSSVRASQTAGFSVVTYTGTGAAASVGHGCGVAPSLIVVKSRSAAGEWVVYHQSLGRGAFLQLQDTAASVSIGNYWGTSNPSSTVFSLNSYGGNNSSGRTYVAYCFAPVEGYSAFGSYTGNGSTDGPFAFVDFKIGWLMIKDATTTGAWIIWDVARQTYNAQGPYLLADADFSESDSDLVDFLSNGFKIRTTAGSMNSSNQTYIWAAFAEHPFQANGGLAR